jgi:O-antigen ligase
MEKLDKLTIAISILILLWSLIVSVANGNFSEYVVGRCARIVLNTILLSIIIRNMNFSYRQFIVAVGIVLFINVIAVYVQQIFPSTKNYFIEFSEYTKGILTMRSFGLYASYDSNGLNICVGLAFWGIIYYFHRKLLYFVFFCVTFLSAIFISRYTIIISSVLCLVFLMLYLKTQKLKSIILIILGVIILGSFFYDRASSILNYSDIDYLSTTEGSYSKFSADVLLGRMLFLPDNPLSMILGEGIDPSNTDNGYIKLIFMIGLIGIIMILYLYGSTIFYLWEKNAKSRPIKGIQSNYIIFYFLFSLFVLMLCFNFKLLLIYGRGFHDMFIIISLALNKILIQEKYYYIPLEYEK